MTEELDEPLDRFLVVAPETRERIHSAVEQTGYTLNTAAQSLRQRRSNTVLVVVPDIGYTFFSEILGGIEQAASAAGLTMLIGNTGRNADREQRYIRYLLNGRADGALLLAEPLDAWFDVPTANELGVKPIVTISEISTRRQTTAVTIDNEAAAYEAVGLLISQGHRRIAHLTGQHSNVLTQTGWMATAVRCVMAALPNRTGWSFPEILALTAGVPHLGCIRVCPTNRRLCFAPMMNRRWALFRQPIWPAFLFRQIFQWLGLTISTLRNASFRH
ncbi:MAG: LacI family transcriptional regulator [Phyllobacteriaceae bacterium]|nr:LacI family transcriptional regulator [Phyllobacteriaceae bacterium]